MEDFTLPSVGGSLKKWVHCAPILPKPRGPFPKLPKKKVYKKNFKKIKTNCIESCVSPRLAGDRGRVSEPQPMKFFKVSPALLFLRMWSTLSHWFQHMPALPRVHLKTSNTHNF
jgi:hypothetical protein